MKTSYKFWYITRQDDVHISECAVRFYEGEISTDNELHLGEIKSVTRYRPTKRLEAKDLEHLKSKQIKKELSGQDTVVYTDKDFGIITTDAELRVFIDEELKKDKKREAITS